MPLRAEGGAYREIPDDRPLQAARAARAEEVQRLGSIRIARAAEYRNAAILSGVILAGFGAALLLVLGDC